MKILVSDTSVLIDLERGEFLESAFSLDHDFVVPDLLFEKELKEYNGAQLIKLGLRIEELTQHETMEVQLLRNNNPALSLPDCFAFVLARERKWPLLTGEKLMRKIASVKKMEHYGVLWVIDEIHKNSLMEGKIIGNNLTKLKDHPRCRLPKKEVSIRIRKYNN